jgi:23S rRNA-/tRNA-specific pseudouridylate synthase
VLQPRFAAGQVEKRYLLRVSGHPAEERFLCDAPIGTEPAAAGGRLVSREGSAASTQFRLLERLPDGSSLLEAEPLTGRTNQIRIHAWHMGMPIIGDPLYLAGRQLGAQQTLGCGAPPMCLPAWQLAFSHPLTGERLSFTSPAPAWAVGSSRRMA